MLEGQRTEENTTYLEQTSPPRLRRLKAGCRRLWGSACNEASVAFYTSITVCDIRTFGDSSHTESTLHSSVLFCHQQNVCSDFTQFTVSPVKIEKGKSLCFCSLNESCSLESTSYFHLLMS